MYNKKAMSKLSKFLVKASILSVLSLSLSGQANPNQEIEIQEIKASIQAASDKLDEALYKAMEKVDSLLSNYSPSTQSDLLLALELAVPIRQTQPMYSDGIMEMFYEFYTLDEAPAIPVFRKRKVNPERQKALDKAISLYFANKTKVEERSFKEALRRAARSYSEEGTDNEAAAAPEQQKELLEDPSHKF